MQIGWHGSLEAFKLDDLVLEALPEAFKKFLVAVGYERFPYVAVGALVFFKARTLATSLQSRLFEPYDARTLDPIRAPHAFDPLRPTLRGPDDRPLTSVRGGPGSARETLWADATAAIRSLEGRRNAKPERPFGFLVIVGRPGSGKTRFAVDLARELGLRARLGGDGSNRPSAMSWFRVQALGRPCGPDDPWDSGWLQADAAHLERLKKWRPRRPTMLLLDDPLSDEAKAVVQELARQADSFAFPVRLVIVNQTFPPDLDRMSALRRLEDAEGGLAAFVLTDETRFTVADVRLLALGGALNERQQKALWKTEDVERFVRLTEGNPLLVEIVFAMLREGKNLFDLDNEMIDREKDALLAERAKRIVEALSVAGFATADAQQAFATATLAGGNVNKDRIVKDFRLPDKAREKLRAIFPVDEIDLKNRLPAIRPEQIGYAFASLVYDDASDEDRERMIAHGWREGARNMLRLSVLFGGRTTALGMALVKGPPEGAGVPASTLFLAYAEAAIVVPDHVHLDAAERERRDRLMEQALSHVAKVPPDEARMAQERLFEFPVEFTRRAVRTELWCVAIGALLARLPPVKAVDDDLQALLTRLKDIVADGSAGAGALHALQDGMAAHLRDLAFGDAPMRALLAVVAAMDPQLRRRDFADLFSTAACIQPPEETILIDGDEREQIMFWRTLAIVSINRTAVCQRAALRLDALAAQPHLADDRDIQLERAQVWRGLSYARDQNAASCLEAVQRVEAIAAQARYAEDRDIQWERAHAWRNLSYARQENAASCLEAVQHVEAIAAQARYAEDHDIQCERAHAWRNLSYARQENVASCLEAVQHVEAIAAQARYAEDHDIQRERAIAWRGLSYARDQNAASCLEAVQHVEAIAAQARYAEDRDIQFERAIAWRNLSYARRENAASCLEAVQRVEAIAALARYAEDRDIQLERAQAWDNLSYARHKDAASCLEAVQHVEAIATQDRYAEDRDMQYERVQAWRFLSYARSENAASCLEAVQHVEAIATQDRYAEDRDMQYERAAAWRFLSYARRENAASCLEAVQRVEVIAAQARFAEDRVIHLECARAWDALAYSRRSDPQGYGEALRRVEALVRRFPDDQEFRQVLTQARGSRANAQTAVSLSSPFAPARPWTIRLN